MRSSLHWRAKILPLAQRKLAIWWGAFGAIALRLILTLVAVSLLDIPYIQAGGSILLFWIAIKLLTDDDSHSNVKEASTLGKAIWTIVVADFVMSLDNVLAIAAKGNGNNTVIILGIGLEYPDHYMGKYVGDGTAAEISDSRIYGGGHSRIYSGGNVR